MHRPSRRFVLAVVVALALIAAPPAWAADAKLEVVATFTILADMVRNVGGDRVTVTTLVGPEGDAHVYEPTPTDARALAEADLVVVNGLGFEGWIDRLIEASGYTGPVVVASSGLQPLAAEAEHGHGHGHNHDRHVDPHAWQDLANGRVYIANIAQALTAADPAHSANYRRRAADYDLALVALDGEIRATLATVPTDRRRVITSHDAFRYFGRAYGIDFLAPAGLSTESEPAAGEVAALIRQMRADRIRVLFIENITSPRLIEQLAREADAVIGGTLFSDALSGPDGPASAYLDMFRYNARQLAKAFTS